MDGEEKGEYQIGFPLVLTEQGFSVGFFFNWAYLVVDELEMERKMTQVLVADKQYQGKYVAFDPKKGKEVIASGLNAGMVIKKAREKGVSVPSVVFIPKENTAYVY